MIQSADRDYDLTYLSLGAGVQSTAALVMATLGLKGCPRADFAVFSDTGDEPPWVYDQVEYLREWGRKHGTRVEITSAGCISEDLADLKKGQRTRFAGIPSWTRGADGREAPTRRQCTREYKIDPIRKFVRGQLGLKRRQRAAGKYRVRTLIGISVDEIMRAKPSRILWMDNHFPLIDANMRRSDCLALLKDQGLPEPRKSACVFCPFHDNATWQNMKNNHPDQFAEAVRVDNLVRDMTAVGVNEKMYLHRSLKPLDEVRFSDQIEGQLDLFNMECEGMCGV